MKTKIKNTVKKIKNWYYIKGTLSLRKTTLSLAVSYSLITFIGMYIKIIPITGIVCIISGIIQTFISLFYMSSKFEDFKIRNKIEITDFFTMRPYLKLYWDEIIILILLIIFFTPIEGFGVEEKSFQLLWVLQIISLIIISLCWMAFWITIIFIFNLFK